MRGGGSGGVRDGDEFYFFPDMVELAWNSRF